MTDSAGARPANRFDTATVSWILMAVLGLGGFIALTAVMLTHPALPFDDALLAWARQWQSYSTLWKVISESANLPLIAIGVGMVIVLFARHHRREALLVAVMLIAVTAGSEAVKQLVARPRPSGTDPTIPGVVYSYPSGHVLEALTIFGIITIHAFRARLAPVLRWLLVVFVVIDVPLVALARVALNAHYPSDVLGAALAGIGDLGVYGVLTRHRGDRA